MKTKPFGVLLILAPIIIVVVYFFMPTLYTAYEFILSFFFSMSWIGRFLGEVILMGAGIVLSKFGLKQTNRVVKKHDSMILLVIKIFFYGLVSAIGILLTFIIFLITIFTLVDFFLFLFGAGGL